MKTIEKIMSVRMEFDNKEIQILKAISQLDITIPKIIYLKYKSLLDDFDIDKEEIGNFLIDLAREVFN